jgi:hypothetical protein
MSAVLNFPQKAPVVQVSAVDQLGLLQAQIATLQDAEKALKEDLKLQAIGLGLKAGKGNGVDVVGSLFNAHISESDGRQSLDVAALEAKVRELMGSGAEAFLAANTKVSKGSITLRVSALKVS